MNHVRLTGVSLLLLTAATVVAVLFSDPGVESGEDKQAFSDEVSAVVDKAPGIFVAQAVQIALAPLAVLAGVGLYLLMRRRSPGTGLIGALLLTLWGLFAALQGIVGVAMVRAANGYVDGDLVAPGSGHTLQLVQVLGGLHWASWLTGASLLGISVAVLGCGASWRARALPRWLGVIAVAAGAFSAPVPLAAVFEPLFALWSLGALLTLGWLLTAGSWLMIFGRRSAAAELQPPTGAPPFDVSLQH